MNRLVDIYSRISRRYDVQHGLITAFSDQRGRRVVVDRTVKAGDTVLDCGAGTGSTAALAARRVGSRGSVVLFDLDRDMLAVAREKLKDAPSPVAFGIGDMCKLPFPDNSFDVGLSTYSFCPLYDPEKGALELYRVVAPGGRLGVAHSTEPENAAVRWLADRVEDIAWRIPSLSMGCRAVSVVSALTRAGGRVRFHKRIGVPLWPFEVFVVEKPART